MSHSDPLRQVPLFGMYPQNILIVADSMSAPGPGTWWWVQVSLMSRPPLCSEGF